MRVIVADATESSSNLRRVPVREPEMDSAAITDSLDAPRMSWGQVGSSQRVRQAGGVRTGLQRPHDADAERAIEFADRVVDGTAHTFLADRHGRHQCDGGGPWTRAMPAAMTAANGSVPIAISSAEHPRSAWNH